MDSEDEAHVAKLAALMYSNVRFNATARCRSSTPPLLSWQHIIAAAITYIVAATGRWGTFSVDSWTTSKNEDVFLSVLLTAPVFLPVDPFASFSEVVLYVSV